MKDSAVLSGHNNDLLQSKPVLLCCSLRLQLVQKKVLRWRAENVTKTILPHMLVVGE